MTMSDGVHLSSEKVVMLDKLCEEVSAKVVISSTWKLRYSLNSLQDILRLVGLRYGTIVDVTPSRLPLTDEYPPSFSRGNEIYAWLRDNPVDKYAIIDDDSDMRPEQVPYFVQTNYVTGLTEIEIEKLRELLND